MKGMGLMRLAVVVLLVMQSTDASYALSIPFLSGGSSGTGQTIAQNNSQGSWTTPSAMSGIVSGISSAVKGAVNSVVGTMADTVNRAVSTVSALGPVSLPSFSGVTAAVNQSIGSVTSSVADNFIKPAVSTAEKAVDYTSAQWEGAKEQYGLAAPLMMIGAVTNPILETVTGIKAGSPEAKEVGREIYKWTGGVFNVPTVALLGRSLSDPYNTETMSLTERGQYLAEHPLEVLEFGATVYAGAGLISGGAAAALGSTGTAAQGIMANEGVSALSKGVSLVKLAYAPLAQAVTPILGYGTAIGLGAYEYNKLTGAYTVGTDADGSAAIVDKNGDPATVDGFSALAYSMGSKFEHIVTGDPDAEAFSNAMHTQGVSSNAAELAQDLGTNDDGSINWAGKIASIPLLAVNAPFGFAEFPLTFGDNVADAQRQGWSEGLQEGDLAKGLINSSIYTGQAIGGSALGMYSFAGDVLIAGPVNFIDAVSGGDGKVLQANWLGEKVANAPYVEQLGLGKYFNPVDPVHAQYPNIDYTIAYLPYMFNLRENVLGNKEAGGQGGFLHYVEAGRGIALKPVDILTLPLNAGLQKAGSAVIELSNEMHNRARLSSQQAALSATQGQSDLEGRITQNSPQQHEFVKDAPILAYKITSAEFKDIPEAIRQYMGATDQTTYTREYLQQNIGSVIALQMNGDKADFYIIGKSTFDQKYSVVPASDVSAKNVKLVNKLVTVPGVQDVVSTDPNVVGALKNAPVPMIKMSDIGYDINSAVTIQSPWGEQTKPAGQDAFLVYDAGAKQYYMVNTDAAGNPISYVAKK